MDEIHRMMREVPQPIYVMMIAIPLLFTALALGLGWYAQAAARRRRALNPAAARSPQDEAFAAGITVAIVPLAFAILMLWGRFG